MDLFLLALKWRQSPMDSDEVRQVSRHGKTSLAVGHGVRLILSAPYPLCLHIIWLINEAVSVFQCADGVHPGNAHLQGFHQGLFLSQVQGACSEQARTVSSAGREGSYLSHCRLQLLETPQLRQLKPQSDISLQLCSYITRDIMVMYTSTAQSSLYSSCWIYSRG